MTAHRRAWARLVSFFRKQKLDHDFNEELASHIDLATEEYERQGLPPNEARRRTLIDLGGIEPSKEAHRETRGLPWLDGILQDIRFAVRTLRRSPGISLTAIATLAIGIGVNATVFSVTNAVLFKGFPSVTDNDRVVYVTSDVGCCVSYPDYLDWRDQATSFDDMALVHGLGIILSDGTGAPERYQATEVTSNTFKLVGQRPILGRDFAPADEYPGAAPVVILSNGFWERRYARDPAIIGRTVRINGAPSTVIGVMPEGFSFPQIQDVWVPFMPTAEVLQRDNRATWFAFGYLAEGATIESARAEMETSGGRLAAAYPLTNADYAAPVVRDFNGFFIGSSENLIYAAMWGAVAFVLLIACANLANLMLARAMTRSREISIRVALGAARWRIVRQLLIESVLLSSVGGMLGWWIATVGVRLYELSNRGPGSYAWRILDYEMDGAVLLYLTVVSLGTGILFGLAPALRLSRLDGNAAWKDGGRGATIGGGRKRLSSVLVTAEMALAVVLLAGAGVMTRSMLNLSTADLGVQTNNVVTALMQLPADRYPDADARISFYERREARLSAIPGVESAALTSELPATRARRVAYETADQPSEEQSRPTLSEIVISPAFFETLGAEMLSGRRFSDADRGAGPSVVIVNQQFSELHWPGAEPIGQRLQFFDQTVPQAWLTVVGVVSNIVQNDFSRQEFEPLAYTPYRQHSRTGLWLVARTEMPPASLANTLRREVQTLDAELPIWSGPDALSDRLAERHWNTDLYGTMFLIFAAIALLLSSVGLYAVISHAISQRTQEIGVRMAIGATAQDIRQLVVKQGMLPLVVGLAIGLAASLAVNRVLEAQLVGVSAFDPASLVVVSIVLIVTALLGSLIPARRATRVNPVDALRSE